MGYSLNKIGLTRPSIEQLRLMRDIVMNYYRATQFQNYEAIIEAPINPKDLDSDVPDILFFDKKASVKVVIEIASTPKEIKDTHFQCTMYLEGIESLSEAFCLDFQTKQFIKFYKIGDEIQQVESSFSDVLNLDIASLLKNSSS